MGPHGAEIGWPSKSEDRKARVHNHHISLKERFNEYQNRIAQEKHPKAAGGNAHETTKAAAWAVFNHHGGGGVGNSQTHGTAVRRPTRFKIEAQMKHEIAHRSSISESVAASWDAGSTLFDSFELDALLKTLDEAANPAGISQQKQPEEAGLGAMVVYSQKHWISRPQLNPPQRITDKLQNQRSFPASRNSVDDSRLVTLDETRPLTTGEKELEQRAVSYKLASNLTLDELYEQAQKEVEDDPFAAFSHTPSPFNVRRNARRSFDSSFQGKGGSQNPLNRSKWKSLLHTLHLDGASGLFHRFQGMHAQVAPHDSQKKLEPRGSRRPSRSVIVESKSDLVDGSNSQKQIQRQSQKSNIDSARADGLFDPRFDPKNLHISKDVNPPPEKAVAKDDRQRSFWKSGFKAVLSRPFGRQSSFVTENEEPLIQKPFLPASGAARRGDNQQGQKKIDLQAAWLKKTDLQSAWTSFTATVNRSKDEQQEQGRQRARTLKHHSGEQSAIEPVSHHEHRYHHHHHHHVSPEGEDYELTVQAITKRVSRSSFEEKLARRFSIEDGGMKAPRNSLVTTRNSLDPSLDSSACDHGRVRVHLTPWEAERGYAKGSYVH